MFAADNICSFLAPAKAENVALKDLSATLKHLPIKWMTQRIRDKFHSQTTLVEKNWEHRVICALYIQKGKCFLSS